MTASLIVVLTFLMQLLLAQVKYETQVAQLIVEIALRVLPQHGTAVAFKAQRSTQLEPQRIGSCIIVAIRMIADQPIAIEPLHIASHAQLQLIAYANQILHGRCLALGIDALLQHRHMAAIGARPIGAGHKLFRLTANAFKAKGFAQAIKLQCGLLQ